MIRLKMGARRPFCFLQLTRIPIHIFLGINLVFCIWVYQHQTLNEFEDSHDQIQNGCPAVILVTLAMKLWINPFF